MADIYSGTVQLAAVLGDNKGSVTVTPTGNVKYDAGLTLNVGKTFVLTTGTGGTGAAGVVLTLSAHGFTTEKLGIFWEDTAGVTQYAYGCTITAYDTNTVTMTLGTASANLPATSSNIIVSAVATKTISVVGSTLRQLMVTSTGDGVFELFTSVPASSLAGATPYAWPQAAGATVPFSATVVSLEGYNGTIAAATMSLSALQP